MYMESSISVAKINNVVKYITRNTSIKNVFLSFIMHKIQAALL